MSLREQFEKETKILSIQSAYISSQDGMIKVPFNSDQYVEWLESKVAELQSENSIKDKAIETWTRNFNRQADELTTLKKKIEDAPRVHTPLEYTGTNLIPDFGNIRMGLPQDEDEQYDVFAMVKVEMEEA